MRRKLRARDTHMTGTLWFDDRINEFGIVVAMEGMRQNPIVHILTTKGVSMWPLSRFKYAYRRLITMKTEVKW